MSILFWVYRANLLPIIILGSVFLSYAHDENVHKAITASACKSSSGLNIFLNENLESQSLIASQPQCSGSFTPADWIVQGSYFEDMQLYGGQTLRSVDHFYTVSPPASPFLSQRVPGEVIGLTDDSEHPKYLKGLPFSIVNSIEWVSQPGIAGPYILPFIIDVGTNAYTWQCARSYEIFALTNSMKSVRNQNMALMLYTLGHVLHLNQDTSQPEHVRNDNHFLKRDIENYARDNYEKNPQWFVLPQNAIVGWINWESQGFTKLLDFWDRGIYLMNAQALNNDANNVAGKKLGLAEFCSGNFLGEDALYAEYFSPGSGFFYADIHYFPFPSLETSTDYRSKTGIGPKIHVSYLKDGEEINRVGVSKIYDGIVVTNHSVLNYLGVTSLRSRSSSAFLVTSTINDPKVLQEYHNILIPKAVEYSAGILDYFFRGTMSVIFNYDASSDTYTFTNKNTSGQDFKDGSFSLFEEDATGARTLAQWYPFGGILPNDSSTNIILSGPVSSGTKFLVVYQGTIGVTNGTTALDPVDANISIAAARPGFEQTTNYPDDYRVTYTTGDSFSTSLDSADFPITPTAGNFEVIINSAILDDYGSIGGVNSTGIGYPSPISNKTVSPSQVSIVGNHLSVNLKVTDVYGVYIGYQNVSITWKVFQPPR